MDTVVQKFPFRVHTVRTDRGHEFQAQFHWHLAEWEDSCNYHRPHGAHAGKTPDEALRERLQ